MSLIKVMDKVHSYVILIIVILGMIGFIIFFSNQGYEEIDKTTEFFGDSVVPEEVSIIEWISEYVENPTFRAILIIIVILILFWSQIKNKK